MTAPLRVNPVMIVIAVLLQTPLTTDPRPELAEETNLALRLDAHNREYTLFEPVVLSVAIQNPIGRSIFSGIAWPLPWDPLELEITYPDGRRVPYRRQDLDGLRVSVGRTFEPGDVLVADTFLFWNAAEDAVAFPEPGAYLISGTYAVSGHERIDAEPIRIIIVEPSNVDRQLTTHLGSHDELVRLFRQSALGYCGDDLPAMCLAKLQQAIELFPSSAYAPMICYGLSSALDWGSQFSRAKHLTERCLSLWPSHPLMPRLMSRQVHVLAACGQTADARTVIDEFERRWPERRDEAKSLRGNLSSSSRRYDPQRPCVGTNEP